MSLDVWLTERNNGDEEMEVYGANITHNLGRMACALRVYDELWHPEVLKIESAKELIKPLKYAIKDLKARPEYYKRYNSPNGWGMYKHFVPWVIEYWKACVKNPDSNVRTST